MSPVVDLRIGEPYGMHLVLQLARCDPAAIGSRRVLRRWAIDLVDLIGMKRRGSPLVEHFGHADPITAGFSVHQWLETSNLTAHFSELLRTGYVDVFSCRDFDPEKVVAFCIERFGAQNTATLVVLR